MCFTDHITEVNIKIQVACKVAIHWGTVPVTDRVRAWVVHSYDHKNMLEMRADVLGTERLGSRLLKHYCHNIVSNVTLSQQLQLNKITALGT